MRITLNNRIEEVNGEYISLGELLRIKKFTFRLLVTKINKTLIKKEEREDTYIKDGDEVLVIHMISGG